MSTEAATDRASSDRASSGVCDLRLMRRIRDGDTAAFVELVERWQPRLARFLRHLGAARQDVDDLIQEIFLRVYNYRARFEARHERAVAAFLLLVARRVHIDSVRRRRPSSKRFSSRPTRVELDEAEMCACPRTSSATLRDDLLDLEEAIQLLSPKLREVVVLVTEHGLSYPEVSQVLGIPVGTVKSRMHYAVRRLSEVFDVKAKV
jgi:RNA polymerase sigma-70 factor (ECF subfamily)